MGLNVCLTLIETSGNQSYIFSTNKLRENVGAPELTYRAGTQWVLEVVVAQGGLSLWKASGPAMREAVVRDQATIEDAGTKIEALVATSGKALQLMRDRETACEIVRAVTLRALEDAPGLDICGRRPIPCMEKAGGRLTCRSWASRSCCTRVTWTRSETGYRRCATSSSPRVSKPRSRSGRRWGT